MTDPSDPERIGELVARLRSNAALRICPYDYRSPDYLISPHDKPCEFCGQENTAEGPDKCTGADMSILKEAAAEIERLAALAAPPTVRETGEPYGWLIMPMGHANIFTQDKADLSAWSGCKTIPLYSSTIERATIERCADVVNDKLEQILDALRTGHPEQGSPRHAQLMASRAMAMLILETIRALPLASEGERKP